MMIPFSGIALPIGQPGTVRAQVGVPHESGRHKASILQRRCPRAGAVSAQFRRLAAQHPRLLQGTSLLGSRYQRLRLSLCTHPRHW